MFSKRTHDVLTYHIKVVHFEQTKRLRTVALINIWQCLEQRKVDNWCLYDSSGMHLHLDPKFTRFIVHRRENAKHCIMNSTILRKAQVNPVWHEGMRIVFMILRCFKLL